MAGSLSQKAVCRQTPEMWPKFGYMKLCVDTDLKCGDIWLHEAVCRQRPELWRQLVT